MEKWDAYTREGVLTDGVLIRGEEVPEGLYHLVCEVLVRHTDGSYLCMKRAMNKKMYPGYWEATAGGSALQGEDKLCCVKRELEEETGIVCNDFKEIGRYVYDGDHCIFYCFVCSVDCDKNSIRLQEGETEDYKWVTEEAFIDFINSGEMVPSQKARFYKYYVNLGYIKKPKMVLFDYGQTLVDESKFNGEKGTQAVLQYATKNKYNRTAKEVQAVADVINDELGRFDPKRRHLFQVEVPNCMFAPYLYESQGIEIPLSDKERDRIFWDAASPGVPTEGILSFLSFLKEQGIRTGVISNITYCEEAVKERIDNLITNHEFEFIIATSAYVFRKPNKRIFELALEKADLKPSEVWYIGDNYECDVVGARNAGLFPVWYTGAINVPDGDKRDAIAIGHWDELKDMILKLVFNMDSRIFV